MIFLAIWCTKNCTYPTGLCNFVAFTKIYLCLLTLNCTRNHVIIYTNRQQSQNWKKNRSSTLSSLKPTFQKYFFKLKLFSAAVKSSWTRINVFSMIWDWRISVFSWLNKCNNCELKWKCESKFLCKIKLSPHCYKPQLLHVAIFSLQRNTC